MREYSVPPVYEVAAGDTAVDDIYANARDHPEHVAVSRRGAVGWEPVSSQALADDVTALAAGMHVAGIEQGDRVALMSRTRYEWLLCDAAILSLGAVTVPVYETSSAEQVEWILGDSGAVAVIVETADHKARVDAVRDRLPVLQHVWMVEDDRPRLNQSGLGVDPQELARRRASIQADDLATIVYTSGTTGRPKGCMLTHGNLVADVRCASEAPGADRFFNPEASTLLFLPLAHILARVIQYAAIHRRVRLGHVGDMTAVAGELQAFRPTVVLSVPRVFEKAYNTAQRKAVAAGKGGIFARADKVAVAFSAAQDTGGASLVLRLQHALLDRLLYSKLRDAMGGQVHWAVSGGAPLGAHLGHFFRGAGINVLEGYGLTETTAGGTLNLPDQQRVGSTGRPLPGGAIRIAADGEVLIQGPYVFRGYWNNDVATKEVFDEEGWFRTGDIGRLDEDGYLFITGRKKDIIVTAAGKNVAPAVLEDRLRSHWLISQALVVGDRRPYVGALLTVDEEAFVSWRSETGKPADAAVRNLVEDPDLRSALQAAVDDANLAVSAAEAIKRWLILPQDFTVEAGEMTPTLKLRRSEITDRYAEHVDRVYG
jgi:long-chain acyl-CoA synthetase